MDRIDEFASQSQKEYGDFDGSITAFDYRKFAELIIHECCNIFVELRTRPADLAVLDVKKHFGIEE